MGKSQRPGQDAPAPGEERGRDMGNGPLEPAPPKSPEVPFWRVDPQLRLLQNGYLGIKCVKDPVSQYSLMEMYLFSSPHQLQRKDGRTRFPATFPLEAPASRSRLTRLNRRWGAGGRVLWGLKTAGHPPTPPMLPGGGGGRFASTHKEKPPIDTSAVYSQINKYTLSSASTRPACGSHGAGAGEGRPGGTGSHPPARPSPWPASPRPPAGRESGQGPGEAAVRTPSARRPPSLQLLRPGGHSRGDGGVQVSSWGSTWPGKGCGGRGNSVTLGAPLPGVPSRVPSLPSPRGHPGTPASSLWEASGRPDADTERRPHDGAGRRY